MLDFGEDHEPGSRPESEPDVRVRVTGMTGDFVAELALRCSEPVVAVKQGVFRVAGVPVGEQRLVLAHSGTEPLANEQSLQELAAGAELLLLTLVRVEGCFALSWSADRTFRLWDLAAGCGVHDFEGYVSSTQLRGVEVSWERDLALSWGGDKTMRLWELQRGQRLRSLGGHSTEVLGVRVDWERSRALSWAADCVLRLWDLQSGMYSEMRGHGSIVHEVELDWQRDRLLSWAFDDAFLWDLGSRTPLRTLCPLPGVRVFSVHPEWHAALVQGPGPSILSWSFETDEGATELGKVGGRPEAVVDWVSGRVVSWCLIDAALWLWSEQGCLKRPVPGLFAVQVDWDQDLALSWSMSNLELRPQLWDLGPNGELLERRGRATGYACGAAWELQVDLDFSQLRAVSWSTECRSLQLWNLEDGAVVHELRGHTGELQGVEVDWAQNRALSWSGNDTTLRVWDLITGLQKLEMVREPCGSFGVHVDWSRDRAFSWTQEAWGNFEFTLELWELEHGKQMMVLNGHTDVVLGVTTAPRQKSFAPSAALASAVPGWTALASSSQDEEAAHSALGRAGCGVGTVETDELLAGYIAGDLDDLIAEYRELLRSMPAGLWPQVQHAGDTRASGEASPYGDKYHPMEEAGSRVRLLMLGDAITMGSPYANSTPVPAAVARMNAGVLVENAGWGGLLAMMLLRPHDFACNHSEQLPLPAPGQHRCDYACILIGSYDAVTLAGTETVVEVQCVKGRAWNNSARPVFLPQDWKTRCPPSLELFERSLRGAARELLATGASVALATPPPLGEDLSSKRPADRLVAKAPFLVGCELAAAVRRVAVAERCALLPLFECCVHRLGQLQASGREPIPWTPKRFWERMNFSIGQNINTLAPGYKEVPWEDVSPDHLRPALCHDLVKLNEHGGAIYGALIQTWLDKQLGMREVPARGAPPGTSSST